MNKIIKINDAISYSLYNKIKNTIFHPSFPWYWLEDPSDEKHQEAVNDTTAFNSTVYINEVSNPKIDSLLAGNLESAAVTIADRCDIRFNNLIRIRIGLLPRKQNVFINRPHIDFEENHNTMLIYLSTCNAPTLIYKNKYMLNQNMSSYEYCERNKGTFELDEEIACIDNTAVIFNGLRYHSSSFPTDVNRRIVATINFQ